MPETPGGDRQLPDVPANVITCADVESRDLEAAYLAGRLSPDDAAAYEAHYFGCDRCWPALQRATELRATLAHTSRRRFRLNPTLAAAAVLVVFLGGWLAMRNRIASGPERVVRGTSDTLVVAASRSAAGLAAVWHPVSGADRYLVRLYAPDGTLLVERETADTAFAMAGDSLPPSAAGSLWQIQALDALRRPVARSALTPAGSAVAP